MSRSPQPCSAPDDRSFSHRDAGTDEAVWAAAIDRVRPTHFADLGPPDEVVVVAPHPDDESLGAGGSIASWSAAGARVEIVVCSDGEAAGTGRDRIAEVRAAARRLTTSGEVAVRRLGLPDGGLADDASRLRESIAGAVAGADVVVSPWPRDGHPDHRAVGDAVRAVAGDRLRLEYPVWAWHWGGPADLPAQDLVVVPLSPSAQRAKAAAVACHRSQLDGPDPVLTDRVLAHFRRDVECFVVDEAGRARLRQVDRSSAAFFDALYRSTPSGDPWDLAHGPDDVGKVAAVAQAVAALGRRQRGLEVGCGPGLLTARLGPLVDELLAVDASARAVEIARRRCAELRDVTVREAHVPAGLREADRGFDLVVLSDVAYYFDPPSLRALVADLRDRTVEGAVLVAAHWTGRSPDHRLDGDTTHRVIGDAIGWPRAAERTLPAHRLDVWARP
ncbi:bifunctional PIG-L family deacetylase/class I SAM-dependent methyltransferase [Dermatobacter hominis]|uniref:bifunctional PIG-L family deacetylase/class I SAM-dependent methyltransferase n=1 Tax=Dermatobacter hominis TaxID=2884263 RepID=UPI001D1020A2|nr:bifunctional PIG-L family deacetylase/class I SAM-dependent methyltransferase [Dermatobacter hominis]UDY37478.1 bifunctional PIG-L family deacetylase/class I SAM-dependent methyltransferase [Dermatobacter hominis]